MGRSLLRGCPCAATRKYADPCPEQRSRQLSIVASRDSLLTSIHLVPRQSAAHANSRRSSVLKKRKLNQQSPGYSARKVLHQTPCGQPGGAPAGSAPRAPEPSQPNSPEIDRKVMDDVSEGKVRP